MKKLIYVEFLGLPGAGKSTLLKSMGRLLTEKGFKVATMKDISEKLKKFNISEKYLYPVAHTLKDRKNWVILFELSKLFLRFYLWGSRERRYCSEAIKMFFMEYDRKLILEKNNYDFFIFEGQFSFLSMLEFGHFKPQMLNQFLKNLIKNDVIRLSVFINTPIEVAIDRARKDYQRESWIRKEFFALNEKKVYKYYHRMDKNIKIFTELLKEWGDSILFIEVDGLKSCDENAKVISQLLEYRYNVKYKYIHTYGYE